MLKRTTSLVLTALLALLLASFAAARVTFSATDFAVGEFRNAGDVLNELCVTDSSFWCERQQDTLTRITTKSMDIFFTEAGEVAAIYVKQQRGQSLNNYTLDAAQNLIPPTSSIPGGAILFDEAYQKPQDVTASWDQISDTELVGTFTYRLGQFSVDKEIIVSSISNTFDVSVNLTRNSMSVAAADTDTPDTDVAETGTAEAGTADTVTAEADASAEASSESVASQDVASQDVADSEIVEPAIVRYAFPGIARQEDPTVKVGQATSFALNPISQPIDAPSYITLQSNSRSSGQAIILRPASEASDYTATYLPPRAIAIGKPLADNVTLNVQAYTGPNELVRYHQEGYKDLPGLFNPNILGRLSLGIIFVLETIQGFVGSWGLSIILLTLFFRMIIWPLMATQTKSMVGMQKIQPKIQELQKKYKDNKEKLTQETMKLYKEAGVNPMGGCLPMVLQMPLFIILWRVFMNFEFNQGFLWIPDLGQPDPFYIVPVLYLAVMFGQSFMSAKGNKDTLRQQLMINGIFIFFIINFPSGVALYLVTSMLVQVGQQYVIQRNVNARPVTT
jgi:YidC/Oxa1 family membrane protein insertase